MFNHKCFAVVPRSTGCLERCKYFRKVVCCRRWSRELVAWRVAKLPHVMWTIYSLCVDIIIPDIKESSCFRK